MGLEPTTSGTTIRRSNQLGDSRHKISNGAPGGIRTPDTRLRRPLLYPTELQEHLSIACVRITPTKLNGAGDGNRTHATSLEGWCSTIELHPHFTQCSKIIANELSIVKRLLDLFTKKSAILSIYFLIVFSSPILWRKVRL